MDTSHDELPPDLQRHEPRQDPPLPDDTAALHLCLLL